MPTPRKQAAFTLIELLSVMAIMMIIAGITVASYFGMVRGSATRSAAAHLHSTLLLAKQTAVMNGKEVHVIFSQSETNGWYAMVQKAGKATYVGGANRRIADIYSDWTYLGGSGITNAVVYNLSANPERSSPISDYGTFADGTPYIETVNTIWSGFSNPNYGWEVHPPTYLPAKYQFGAGLNPPAPFSVIYRYDGTTAAGSNITIYEKSRSNAGDPHIEIAVAPLTGFVTVTY